MTTPETAEMFQDVYRVERAHDEESRQKQERQSPPKKQTQTQEDVGPVEGDDGHFHVDVRA